MASIDKSVEHLLEALKERAKELNCLYEIEELFSEQDSTLSSIMQGIVRAIPPGWQYTDVCKARITYGGTVYESPGFHETPWVMHANLSVQEELVGKISVYYIEERPQADEGPFLKEERKLIDTIADRLERRILHEGLRTVFRDQVRQRERAGEWSVIIDLLKRTDVKLLARITRRMLNYLSWSGIGEAKKLQEQTSPTPMTDHGDLLEDLNRPSERRAASDLASISDEVFRIASRYMGERDVVNSIQKWILEDRSNFLVKILEDPGSSFAEIANAIDRFHHVGPHGITLPPAREKGCGITLIRRLLTDDPAYINVAKRFVGVDDFHELIRTIIFPAGSRGKLGGKGAGIVLAKQIFKKASPEHELLQSIRTPKTWYLTSDGILNFINHNDLEEIVEQKYEDIAQVRQEYPYVVHVFKNSELPPNIVNGLSVALDDFGEHPLIVRSSSLLEDRQGTSFAGKYKSLFIANQGSKRERLIALMDAITEVYASTFSADAIEYRIQHGMIDSHEEMGILIQEVVGKRIGRYFLPAFAGVVFTDNDLRWSPRIRREDGLLRMVPGLGTRAVDRVSEDYPILIAPGQPNLRANVSVEEKVRYSPKNIDVINLETNSFETVEVRELLRECGDDYPMVRQLLSVVREDHIESPGGIGIDFRRDTCIFTFEGLITNTSFIQQIRTMINLLKREMGTAVDIEFAHDGTHLYLLQCRAQSYTKTQQPAVIPRDVPKERVLFSAHKYVTNGTVHDITHIVYVDPQAYGDIAKRSEFLAVGRAISKLNHLLPKRQFVLMGPGRWGSRGDVKLGVSVTYSDINNTAMLIEIARSRKGYVPELSFGTHFFQDLAEASIRYLPLYPEDSQVVFNEEFFTGSKNILRDLLPEFAALSQIVRVIEVPTITDGQVAHILMNGEQDEALAILAAPSSAVGAEPAVVPAGEPKEKRDESHWKWRLSSAERLASQLDPSRFGVKALYVFGSTKNGTAGPGSDIDLLVHFGGTSAQKKDMLTWMEGWSLCLSEMNYLRTGYRTEGLLDIHLVTDEDIRKRTNFAQKIGAVTDAPRPLTMARPVKEHNH